jgi:hypothetical protein
MWYALNEAIGKILLGGVVLCGIGYGGYWAVTSPPVLQQGDDRTPRNDAHSRAARKETERHLQGFQDEASRNIQKGMEIGRSVGS